MEWQAGVARGGASVPDSLRQRGKSWELKVYLGRDAVSGRKRWAYRSFRGGKREAQLALAALVAEADRGGLDRPAPLSLSATCWRSGSSTPLRRSRPGTRWRPGAYSTAT